MRAPCLALLTAGLVIGAAAPARAQSLYGPGGLFLHPTAAMAPRGQVTPGVLLLPQHNPVVDVTRTWLSASVDYGASDNLEVGATFLNVAGWDKDPSFGGFFKYRLLEARGGRPDVAVGFTGLFGGDLESRVGFLALRKTLARGGGQGFVGHLGVQYVDARDGLDYNQWQPFAGIEAGISSRLTFIAEARPRQEFDFGTPLALTLSYRASSAMNFAVTWANNGLSDRPYWGFGAGYSLGSRR